MRERESAEATVWVQPVTELVQLNDGLVWSGSNSIKKTLEITILSKTVSLGLREVKFNKSELLFIALDNNNETFLLGGKGQLKVQPVNRG